MRILHVITRLDCGGSAENTLVTAIGQISTGHHVSIVSGMSENPASPYEARARDLGADIQLLPCLVRRVSFFHDFLALMTLCKIVHCGRYDLLHTHTSKAGILGRLAAVIVRVPLVVHTPHGHIFYGYFSRPVTGVFIALERLLMRTTQALITLSQREKNDYLAHGIGPAERIFPIPSGIDLGMFRVPVCSAAEARSRLGLRGEDFVAGTVARLVPIKNHGVIVSAAAVLCAKIPALRFVFVGDGELRGELETRIEALGLSVRFTFTGWCRDVRWLLPAFDIFVMCSRNEGMGRAFVEAQAAGIPVIGSDIGGIPEVLRDTETGYLVRDGDPEDLAGKMELLYKKRADSAQYAQRCRQWAEEFSAEVMIARLEQVYALIAGKSTV